MEGKIFYQFLLERYVNGTASGAEVEQLFTELEKRKDDADWEDMIHSIIIHTRADETYEQAGWQPVIEKIIAAKSVPHAVKKWKTRKWMAAASIIVVVGLAITAYLVNRNTHTDGAATLVQNVNDIAPGQKGAILTLADSSQVLLDTIKNGTMIALQAGAKARVVNGSLVYDAEGSAVVYNTIVTPKGREYRVTLPDGTIVWLNAQSSIRYPTAFTGGERKVSITGEAYLEVTKNAKMPFRIQLPANTQIQVLGTRFNVNAYDDEPAIKTTLAEGAVSVTTASQQQKLVAGQQAQVNDQQHITITEANVAQELAWKNGLFAFNEAGVETVMRQLSRWYNVEVKYEGAVTERRFVGQMPRSYSLSAVLEVLQASDVHFRISNGQIIVKGQQ